MKKLLSTVLLALLAGTTTNAQILRADGLENYAKELTEDVVDMVSDMSAEEKNLLKTKMQTLVQKIQ